jgi:putative ABC transport system permease protein
MKYLHLVFANLRRKKIRTTLTLGSFFIALVLFGVLAAVHAAFYGGLEVVGVDRLFTISKVSLIQPLPFSYKEKIEALAGVEAVTYATWFGGVYQDERNFFAQFAVDVDGFRAMYSEFKIPDEQWTAFAQDRTGCVIGRATAERYGFKLGDRVPLKGTIFPGVWEFNVRAIYEGTRDADDETQFWFHRKYLEERGPQWVRGTVGWYVVRVANPDDSARVASAIDGRFANSPDETKTEPEAAFAAAFVKQMGNIEMLLLTIGGVVFFTLLLVTGNTMAIAVRERVGELAVLKTIGFSDRFVLGLVLAESVLLALVGGGLGVLFATGMVPGIAKQMPGFTFFLPTEDMVLGVALAVAVGLVAGALPAISAMRLRVVDALRRV